MVLHDFRCPHCEKVFEKMVAWDVETNPCECGKEAKRVFISHREYRAQSFDPVLVYKDKDGNIKFPGRNEGRTPEGYEPVYLRTTSEVRSFERQMNQRERERYFQHKEKVDGNFAPILSARRRELYSRMQQMSEAGRDFARTAIRDSDERPSVNTRFDPGFHIEAFSNNSSNRAEWRDRDTGQRGRK